MLVPGAMQDLSFLTRDWTHALRSGSTESSLLYHQGSPLECLFDGEMVCGALKSCKVSGKAAAGLRGTQRNCPLLEHWEETQPRHTCAVSEKVREEKRAQLNLKGHDRKSGLFILLAIWCHQKGWKRDPDQQDPKY